MKKIIIGLGILLLIAAVVAPAAAAGSQSGKSHVWSWDWTLYSADGPVTIGTLTVNMMNGHWVFNGNPVKYDKWLQAYWKENEPTGYDAQVFLWSETGSTDIGRIRMTKSATFHGEGTLDQPTLDAMASWFADANVMVMLE